MNKFGNRLCRANGDQQLKKLMVDGIEWMKANEPGTLEFSVYEEKADDGSTTISMCEK